MKTIRRMTLCLLIIMFAFAGTAAAQDSSNFPERAVTWIVPFDAGGGADTWTRIIATQAEEVWGVPFIVQNRPGQGGTRGWSDLLREPADGYTIIHASPTPVITLLSQDNPPFQPNQVKMVGFLGSYENILAAKPNAPWATWKGLVEYAQKNPGQLTIGGTNAPMLAVAFLMDQAGLEVNFIPYSGTGAATTDFLGGHIDMLAATTTSITALLPEQAVMVVNTSDEALRSSAVSQIKDAGSTVPPSATDLGYEGFSFPRWVGVHPDTSDEVVQRISNLLGELMANEEVMRRISETGEEVNFVERERAQQRYEALIRQLQVSVQLLQ